MGVEGELLRSTVRWETARLAFSPREYFILCSVIKSLCLLFSSNSKGNFYVIPSQMLVCVLGKVLGKVSLNTNLIIRYIGLLPPPFYYSFILLYNFPKTTRIRNENGILFFQLQLNSVETNFAYKFTSMKSQDEKFPIQR